MPDNSKTTPSARISGSSNFLVGLVNFKTLLDLFPVMSKYFSERLLDASQAFDKVNYVKLFQLLFDRKVNPMVIRCLLYVYQPVFETGHIIGPNVDENVILDAWYIFMRNNRF